MNFFDVVRPIYIYNKFLCLMPFSVTSNNEKVIFSHSPLSLIYGIFLLVFISVSTYLNADYILNRSFEKKVDLFALQSVYLLSTITCIFSIVYYFFYAKKYFSSIFDKISSIDILLYGVNLNSIYHQNRRNSVKILFIHFVFEIINRSIDIYNEILFQSWFYFTSILVECINLSLTLQFLFWIWLLNQKFKYIDEKIENDSNSHLINSEERNIFLKKPILVQSIDQNICTGSNFQR